MAKKRPTPGKRRPAAPNPWPARLKALREHYGLSRDEAAERIASSGGTWRNWEQGIRRPGPMIVRLLELAFPEFFSKS